jgi:hypothetical protein
MPRSSRGRRSSVDKRSGTALLFNEPVVAICHSCNDLGVLRGIGGNCWLCGGWVGHEYPVKLAIQASDLARGWGAGFFGGLS